MHETTVGQTLLVMPFHMSLYKGLYAWMCVSTDIPKLLLAVTMLLPILLVRALYSCISVFTSAINKHNRSLELQVLLGILMEFIMTMDLVAFRIIRLHIHRVYYRGTETQI